MTEPRRPRKPAALSPPDEQGRQELIPAPPARERSFLFVPADASPVDYPTNLPNTAWGKAVRVNAENASEFEPDRSGVVQVPVAYFLVHPSIREDEATGEVTDCLRTVLISPEGQHVATTSEVVRKRLFSLIGHFGPGPWLPPIQVVIRTRRNRSNTRTYHEMHVVFEQEEHE